MRNKARTALAVAAALTFSAGAVQAQTSLFAGVGFGFGGAHAATSLFVGTTLGLGYPGAYGNEYGIYSATYDGWGLGYRGARHYHYSRDTCWDYYWDSYWDPYANWYADCVMFGPYHYDSFRARSWRSRWYGGPSATFVYVRDPYWSPWGPYWAYDPWGSYWNGYWDGRGYDRFGGWYYGGRVRTVYASGGRRGVTYVRPSPLVRSGPEFKENPRGSTVRTAVRRPSSASLMPSPALTAAAVPTRDGTRRTATPRASGGTAVGRPAAQAEPAHRAAPVARPSDRLSGSGRLSGGVARGPRGATRTPAVDQSTARSQAPRISSGAAPRTPSSRLAPDDRPSARSAPTGTRPSARAPIARSAPETRSSPRSDGRAAPGGQASPRAAPRAIPRSESQAVPRSEPRSAPRAAPREAPRTAPRATPRSAPRAAPRSAPRAAPRSAPSAAPRSSPSSGSSSRGASRGSSRGSVRR